MIRTLPGFWWKNNHWDGCAHTLKIQNLHIQGWTNHLTYNKTNEETKHVLGPPKKTPWFDWTNGVPTTGCFFFLDLWTSTGFRSLCGLGHLSSHHQEALFTWARSRREENPEARWAAYIAGSIFAYHHSVWYNCVEPKKSPFSSKKLGQNGHPRFLKHEMWDNVYFIH